MSGAKEIAQLIDSTAHTPEALCAWDLHHEAFYREVGGINLVGTHPSWPCRG